MKRLFGWWLTLSFLTVSCAVTYLRQMSVHGALSLWLICVSVHMYHLYC
jgi:hypothetical protein